MDLFTRRQALEAGAASAMALAAGNTMAAPRRKQPNIIFIMADDLGYADLSCYGRGDYQTPHIDRLAEQGVRFLQGYANSAVCSATRTALATGRYQYRLPVGLEEPVTGASPGKPGLPPDHPTIASLLKKAGYQTMLIGKWHLGELPEYSPNKSGYDHFFGFRGGTLDYFSHIGTSGKEDLWEDDRPLEETGYLTTLLGNRAVSAIDDFARSQKPFFLSLHFNAPHWPWEGPNDQAESRRIGKGVKRHDSGSLKTYSEMVKAMDDEVGRVLQTLERNHLSDNSIVVFTSDNGGERFSDSWPFSGQKTELLEGGLRIPAIVRWPGVAPAGAASQQAMITMDWVPTLLAAAGASADIRFPSDGIDVGPFIRNPSASIPRKLYWRYKANRQRAMRDRNWKYLKILENKFLFNIEDDPRERANLKDRHPDIFARLESEWRAWNATMLPERDDTFTEGVTGAVQADHIGALPADMMADDGL